MMKDIEIYLSHMSTEELDALSSMVEAHRKSRKKERFDELRKNLLDAVDALMVEFPYASCCVNVEVDEENAIDGEMEVDLLYHLKGICPNCICMT